MATRELKVCSNPVSTYFLSDALHFLSYLYAFYVFRWCENEELNTTMEKVRIFTLQYVHACSVGCTLSLHAVN